MFSFLFNLFRKKSKEENLGGLLNDPRPLIEKEKDYLAEEIFEFSPHVWKERNEKDWRKYPIFNQDGSSSCVSMAVSKAMGIENVIEENKFVHFSARDIYTRRKNFPYKGMYFQNGMEIASKSGSTIEQLMPSQKLQETDMNRSYDRTNLTEQVALPGKMGGYFRLPIDIDKIAKVIESTKKGILLGVKFGPNEWNRKVPKVLISYSQSKYGHAVVATNAILYNGKRSLIIEDSWGPNKGINGRRILTEDWFETNKVIFAGYFQKLDNKWRDKEKPSSVKCYFEKDLRRGQQTLQVEKLQEVLQLEELFPINVITSGWYGPITAKAVLAFQKKYKVASIEELESLAGRRVGLQTRQTLNELYN